MLTKKFWKCLVFWFTIVIIEPASGTRVATLPIPRQGSLAAVAGHGTRVAARPCGCRGSACIVEETTEKGKMCYLAKKNLEQPF